MGTYYNQQYGTELEAEEANLVHPEEITAIHKAYIEAEQTDQDEYLCGESSDVSEAGGM